MIEVIIKLYRARKDPVLAAQIASEIAIDGAVEYASWPIRVAKFWMTVGIGLTALLFLISLWAALALHWSLAFPALLFAAMIYGIVRIWRGLNSGRDHITRISKTKVEVQVQKINISQP